MVIWGIDIGVRSVYIARIESGLSLYSLVPKKGGERDDELRNLRQFLAATIDHGDVCYVEEPPLAGPRNVRTFLQLGEVAGVCMASLAIDTRLVEVAKWKKAVIGNGGASKDDISRFLARTSPDYHDQCGNNQNYVDATCIALYGQKTFVGKR